MPAPRTPLTITTEQEAGFWSGWLHSQADVSTPATAADLRNVADSIDALRATLAEYRKAANETRDQLSEKSDALRAALAAMTEQRNQLSADVVSGQFSPAETITLLREESDTLRAALRAAEAERGRLTRELLGARRYFDGLHYLADAKEVPDRPKAARPLGTPETA